MLRPSSASERPPMPERRVVFLSGLPRSGSTFLANLLNRHSHIHATATSPLYPLFERMRSAWSSEVTSLAQMDDDFEAAYARLIRSARAFIDAWVAESQQPVTIDKHRGWLSCIEALRALYPRVQIIVCLRDLRDVYGSLERQHRRTVLLTYPDDTEVNLVEARAGQFFSAHGVIGSPLRALQNLADIPDPLSHVFVVRHERLIDDSEASIAALLDWLGVPFERLPLTGVTQTTHEADSYYRFKFPHRIQPDLRRSAPNRDDLSPRVLNTIIERYAWFYRAFYGSHGDIDLTALTGVSSWSGQSISQDQPVARIHAES